MTYGAVCATKEAWNYWGSTDTKDTIDRRADFIQTNWNNDIANGNSNYEITVYNHYTNKPDLTYDGTEPTDTKDGLKKARTWIDNNTDLFSSFDSIVIIDSREYSDNYIGRAYVEKAGTNYGAAYVNGSGGKKFSAHELGHNYGGKHADTSGGESTFKKGSSTLHSLTGNYGDYSCNGNKTYGSLADWFSSCARSKFRSYIDNNGL